MSDDQTGYTVWTIQLPYISHENREVQTSINKLIKNQPEEARDWGYGFHLYYKPSRRRVINQVLDDTAERLSSTLSHSSNTTTERPRRVDLGMPSDTGPDLTELAPGLPPAIAGYLKEDNLSLHPLSLHPRRYVVAPQLPSTMSIPIGVDTSPNL